MLALPLNQYLLVSCQDYRKTTVNDRITLRFSISDNQHSDYAPTMTTLGEMKGLVTKTLLVLQRQAYASWRF